MTVTLHKHSLDNQLPSLLPKFLFQKLFQTSIWHINMGTRLYIWFHTPHNHKFSISTTWTHIHHFYTLCGPNAVLERFLSFFICLTRETTAGCCTVTPTYQTIHTVYIFTMSLPILNSYITYLHSRASLVPFLLKSPQSIRSLGHCMQQTRRGSALPFSIQLPLIR